MNKSINILNLLGMLLAVFYISLPIYFSFEISSIFPSFTVSRLILLLIIFVLLFVTKKIVIPNTRLMKIVYLFSGIIVFVNFVHLGQDTSNSLKTIFSIILENIMLIIVICSCIRTKKSLILFLKFMVLTSALMTILALIEFFTGFNIFYLLTTTTRTVYQASYTRLGMTRAESAFGHAVYFGVYSSSMFPFSWYFYRNTKESKYFLISALNILGVLISGSRGQMIAIFTLISLMSLKKVKKMKRKYIYSILLAIPLIMLTLFLFPSLTNYVLENIKSVLNIFGFNFQVSSNFGINEDGLSSRLIQLSGIDWVINKGAFYFGLGSNSAAKGLVSYYWNSTGWQTVESIDIGFVGWILDYGIFGTIAYTILFVVFLLYLSRKSNKLKIQNLYNPFKWFFVVYTLNLFSSIGVDRMLWIIISLVICYEVIDKSQEVIDKSQEK